MSSRFERFLGGSPGSVLLRLLFLSLLVGAFMAMIGVTPADLVDRVFLIIDALRDLGLDAFGTVGKWLVYGAIVVVPIWLIARLLGAFR